MPDLDLSGFPEGLRLEIETLLKLCEEKGEKDIASFVIDALAKSREVIERHKEQMARSLKQQADADEKMIGNYLEFEYFGFVAMVMKRFPETESASQALRKLVSDQSALEEVVSSWARLHHGELVREEMIQKIINDLYGFRLGI